MNFNRAYVGASLIAIAGILFWVFLMPLYDNVMAQRDALADRATILENRNTILTNISALTKQYADRSSEIQRFASIVPAQKSVAELVSSVQALASQNGLQLTSLNLSADTNQGKNVYHSQSIDMGLSGNYLAFKSFLIALEHNLRIIDITSIDASPNNDNSSIIGFRIRGNAYYIK
jgi:Tfp pilus assembly protein PilO